MDKRAFGKTGLTVSPLGLGTAELGLTDVSPEKAARVLDCALDLGVNVIDTAACYGESETKIGAAISGRRAEYVLVSKCGHRTGDLQDPPEWSGRIVEASVERSLRRLRTDHLDVLLLHSCTAEQLGQADLIDALRRARQAGKTRFIGYSGDGEAAARAIAMGLFDVLETSINIADQAAIDANLPAAAAAGMGVLAKRPVANSCWRDLSDMGEFYVGYARPYAERLRNMGVSPEGLGFDGSWLELALRFTVFEQGVSTAIIGSRNCDHIRQDLQYLAPGPLPPQVKANLRDAWRRHAQPAWVGLT